MPIKYGSRRMCLPYRIGVYNGIINGVGYWLRTVMRKEYNTDSLMKFN